MELNQYHQKVSIGVASQVPKRLMTQDLKKTKNFKKSPEMLGKKRPPKKDTLTVS